MACHEHALRIDPNLVSAHINRGNVLGCSARMKEALGSYVDAIALEPEHFEAHFNASITRLCLGDYREGWKQYEYRWKRKEFARDRRDLPERMWRGEKDLDGKAVLLFSEQGFGDTIQFMRYAPLVAALGARVILVVQRPLIPLAVTVPGVSLVSGDTEPLPDFDFYCPLLSVPLGFQTEIATIPASIPYIRAQQDRTAKWYGISREATACALEFAGPATVYI